MDHFRVKVHARADSTADLGDAILVFHRWIQQNTIADELLIDVADYRHVPSGPGVVLVGHDAFRSLDLGGRGLGLLYTRRTAMNGSVADKLRSAVEAAMTTCGLLEAEPEFAGKLYFDKDDIEVSVNDRLLAPNNDATWRALEPVLSEVFPTGLITRAGAPGDLFTVSIRSERISA
jgi:hypothetical protein